MVAIACSEGELSLPMHVAILPLATIDGAIFMSGLAIAMLQVILEVASVVVSGTVPGHQAMALHFVFTPFTYVDVGSV